MPEENTPNLPAPRPIRNEDAGLGTGGQLPNQDAELEERDTGGVGTANDTAAQSLSPSHPKPRHDETRREDGPTA